MSAISAYAAWRALETEHASLDLLAGARFFSLDVGLMLQPGRAEGRSYDLDDDWVDPLVRLRSRYAVTDAWFLTAADLSGFGGSSDESWQAMAAVSYQSGRLPPPGCACPTDRRARTRPRSSPNAVPAD